MVKHSGRRVANVFRLQRTVTRKLQLSMG